MKAKQKNYTYLIIGIFALILVSLAIYNQGFVVVNEKTWVPEYWRAECSPRADNLQRVQITTHTDQGQFYRCTTQGTGKYIPDVPGVQCSYEISAVDSATVYICNEPDSQTSDLGTNECTKVFDLLSSNSQSKKFSIEAGESIYINTNKVFGDADVYAEYPSYGLRVVQASNFGEDQTTSCVVNTITQATGTTVHFIDRDNRIEVLPGSPLNAVSGLKQAISTQVVRISGINGGRDIYITRPGFYNIIKEAEDGFRYVDTTQEYSDSRIQCIPRTAGCSDEAKITQLEDQSCDIYGGALVGYSPVQGDTSKLCKYSCTEGKLSLTNECVSVPSSCPSGTIWDVGTGECISLVESSEAESQDYFILTLVVVTIAIVIIMILASIMKKRR